MLGLQPIHLVLIHIIALVIFGPSRLPELGRSLGQSINEFKNATRELTDPVNQAADGTRAESARENRGEPVADSARDNGREPVAEKAEK